VGPRPVPCCAAGQRLRRFNHSSARAAVLAPRWQTQTRAATGTRRACQKRVPRFQGCAHARAAPAKTGHHLGCVVPKRDNEAKATAFSTKAWQYLGARHAAAIPALVLHTARLQLVSLQRTHGSKRREVQIAQPSLKRTQERAAIV
jgi:hypothetical protein